MSNALAIVTGAIQEARDDFTRVLSDRSISFEREAGFAIDVLQNNDYALGIAMKNKQSVISAVKKIAAIGISLNPARRQAYLVPRGGQICLDIGYIGLIDIAVSSGSILWAQAELVRENDGFSLNGYDKPPTHNFNPFGKDRGEIVGAYVVAKLHNGDYLTTTMSIDDVYSIRNRSEAYKRGNGPWKTDEGEMIKKTVIKRAYKLWPKTERMDRAMDQLDRENGEGLAADTPPDWVDVAPMIAEALAAKTDAEALAYWKTHNSRLAKQPADHRKLKEAISQHRMKLREAVAEDARTIEMPTKSVKPAPVDDEFVRQMDKAADEYFPE
ncbi:MAG: recombinase RecT [Bacillota bacterium]